MSLNHPLLSINLLQYSQSKLINNAIDISDIFILYLIIVCNIITKSMNRALYYLKYVYIFITKEPVRMEGCFVQTSCLNLRCFISFLFQYFIWKLLSPPNRTYQTKVTKTDLVIRKCRACFFFSRHQLRKTGNKKSKEKFHYS